MFGILLNFNFLGYILYGSLVFRCFILKVLTFYTQWEENTSEYTDGLIE